jgi:hypothetical protein
MKDSAALDTSPSSWAIATSVSFSNRLRSGNGSRGPFDPPRPLAQEWSAKAMHYAGLSGRTSYILTVPI